MRRMTFAAAVLCALVATSYAVAHGIEGAKSAKAVAGGFNAAAASVSTRTCTTSDGKAIVVTDGKYTGAATGDPDLTGPITVRARSTVNTTDGVGVVDGRFKIDVASGRDTEAAFSAVYDHGTIAGLAAGRAHDPGARLIANLSATFAAATGFTGAKIGGGTAPGSAVEVSSAGGCRPAKVRAEKSEARGAIAALSTSSITVAGLTCAIPADKSAEVNAKFKQGDRAEIHCALANGQNTLTRIEKKH
jgi:hypothetical protein